VGEFTRQEVAMSRSNRRSAAPHRPIALLAALLLSPAAGLAQAEPGATASTPTPTLPGAAASAPAAAGPTTSPGAERIGYQVVPIVSGHRHDVTTSLAVIPIRAADGRPLVGEALYQQLGRPDLVAEYRARETRRDVTLGVGAAMALGGLVYAVAQPGPRLGRGPEQFRRDMDAQAEAQARGMVGSAVGMVVMLVGALTDPNPVGEAELERLIDAHNRTVGAAGSDSPPRAEAGAPEGAGPRVAFQAGLLPGGAMGGLAVVF
jgi:hypothetical protein